MANMLQYLHDITKARYREGGGLRFFVFRVAVEEQGIEACRHGTHDVGLEVVADHEGGVTLGTRPLEGIVEE